MNKMTYTLNGSKGPVILLLHGFLGDKNQWNDIIKTLYDKYAILTIELPGHGESPSCNSYTIADLAIEISKYLTNIQIDKVHFIGHSMGGYVGAAFASAFPQQLHSLTLINSMTGPDTIARKLMRDRAIKLIDRYQEAYVSMAIGNLFTPQEHISFYDIIENVKTQAQKIKLESIMAALRAMRDRPSQKGMVTVPLTYVYGLRDTVIDKLLIENELDKINCRAHTIDGGHMLLLTHSTELLKMLHFIE